MENPKIYASEFEKALPDLLAMLERLVNIDSGSYHVPGVMAVVDDVGKSLAELGFAIERHKLPDRGDQLSATLRLDGSGPRVLILGHADTVWPAGTVAEWPFARSGDRLTGPGVGDMKGGVVSAVFALRILLARKLKGLSSIRFLLVPDEELGSPLSRAWIESAAREADVCLTLEPNRPKGGVVTARGAVGAVYIEAAGISAHCGAAPENGASAVRALADLVPALEALSRRDKDINSSVGIFRGGAARQVIPPNAELHLDLRAPDDASAKALLDEVKNIVARPPADPRVKVSIRGGFGRPAFPNGAGTQALYDLAEEICKAVGAPIFAVKSRGGSDGSFAAALGVPTLDGLGPTAHDTCSRRETVEVSSIPQRGALLAGLIAGVAAGRPIPRA